MSNERYRTEASNHDINTRRSSAGLDLVEEQLTVDKHSVVTGKVRVVTHVETIEQPIDAELERQDVEITRIPQDRLLDRRPEIRTEGEVTIVPIVEEVLVVERRLVLKEELHIRRRTTTETVRAEVPLRRQTAVVERVEATTEPLPGRHPRP